MALLEAAATRIACSDGTAGGGGARGLEGFPRPAGGGDAGLCGQSPLVARPMTFDGTLSPFLLARDGRPVCRTGPALAAV